MQIVWFVFNTVARFTKGYAVTTFEITTLGYIVCTLCMLGFWWHKPMDVQHPIVLKCTLSLSHFVDPQGHPTTESYHNTPLNFIGREEWIGSRLWTYYVNLLRKLRLVHCRRPSLPKRKFSSFNFPPITRPMLFLMLGISLVYASIFLVAWNMYYPSRIEQILWQVSSLGTVVLVVIGGLFEISFTLLEFRQRSFTTEHPSTESAEILPHRLTQLSFIGPPTRRQAILRTIRNHCPDSNPSFDVPIRSLIVTTPVCALYTIFRLIILVEDVLTLRKLPASAFVTVDWAGYFPNIQ